jgi:serine/threonine-protein kinase
MAPEQAAAQHREVEARTDLWALGASLFTLLSGEFVHEAENGGQTLIRAATKPARSLASAAPHLPAAVIELVDRALMFEKSERWESAAAMRGALLAVHRELFGELSREPLRACLVGVEAPRVRISRSAVSVLGKGETTADSPAAVLFDAERTPTSSVSDSIARVARSQARQRRKRAVRVAAWAAALVAAVPLLMRVMSSARMPPVAAVAPTPSVYVAQTAIALPLAPTVPSTVAASVQAVPDTLPAPPSNISSSSRPRASGSSPPAARTTHAASPAPTASSAPPPPAPSNPLDLELQ